MKNVNLNLGGLIGALIGGGLVAYFAFRNIDINTAGRGVYRAPIIGLVGGAFAGNFLWKKLISGRVK